MAAETEPAKLLLPYLQRADELQKHEPLVAYYCRLYAMERGLRIPQAERTKTTNTLLISLMNQLEKDKKSLKLGPDDHLHVEGFASSVFAKADKQDRAGRADLNTAKTFYAASIFFEILTQFGEPQPDLEQKQKYSVWKAADIRKALKEGRKPVPGPPGGDKEDLSVLSSGEYDLEPSRDDFATAPDPSSVNPTARTMPDSDSSPRPYNQDNFQHSTSISPQSSNVTLPRSSSLSPRPQYPTNDYSPDNFHPPPPPPPQPPLPPNTSDHSLYHQSSYQQHQPQQPEPHPQLPQHYPSHDVPPYSYPNFQSYPSFTESTLPTAPSHFPSYHQGTDAPAPYANSSPPNATSYPSSAQYNSGGRNGSFSEASPPPVKKYEYDSSYQPPPEKIAEAHKAARFAVGALAFDDVSIAVEHLKKSLELLTNPSAGH